MTFVQVIRQAKGEAAAKFVREGQVRLFGIGVNEAFALGVAEGLKAQGKASRQVVLVDKKRLRKIQGLELLLIGKISQRGVESPRRGGGALRGGGIDERPLKNGNSVQISGVAGAGANGSAAKG